MKRAPMATAMALALAAWAAASGSALADPGAETKAAKDKEVKREVRRVVVVDKDGERRVIEGEGPRVRRGFLGIGLTELTPELRTHFGVPDQAGVMVSRVESGSPAEKAGVKVGDILTSIDGKDVKVSWDVMSKVRGLEENQQVPLEVWRDGKVQTVTATATLRERPELDMGPMFMRSEDGDNLFFNIKRGESFPEGMPMHFEIPAPGGPDGPGPHVRVMKLREREADLEKRLKEMEKRINELESQLKKK